MGYKISVDTEKCLGDGECADVCPVDVYVMRDDKAVVVNMAGCLGCLSCVEVCGRDAIRVFV